MAGEPEREKGAQLTGGTRCGGVGVRAAGAVSRGSRDFGLGGGVGSSGSPCAASLVWALSGHAGAERWASAADGVELA